ncbi:Hypp3307 [Branchiostoma lanceolatum]|uniref:Hypp3307 protein n=1 Tax=Branchiostoma lanceolatum TaxID=7740 RepID=A0A8J9ZZE9_BRALA|nr:Hypp3307 [Branchiostoma lanceolatum]
MAKLPMSPVWLIIIGLSFTYVKADGFKKTKAFGEAADDVGKGTLHRLWNAVGDKLDYLCWAWDIADDVYTFSSRVSPEFEKYKKGKISGKEFGGKVGKAAVKSGCSMTGSYYGAMVGQAVIPIPGVGAFVGSFVGGNLGEMVVDLATEE